MSDPRDLFDLTGKVACVTGASSGIGRRAAVTLAAAGAYVVGVARRKEALVGLQAELGEGAASIVADVAARAGVEALVHAISQPFGAPDIVIHAAGVNTREPADDVTAEGWDQTLALNLSAPFFHQSSHGACDEGEGLGTHREFRLPSNYTRFSRWDCLRGKQGRRWSNDARDGGSVVQGWHHGQRDWPRVFSDGTDCSRL